MASCLNWLILVNIRIKDGTISLIVITLFFRIAMLVDRERELIELNVLLQSARPSLLAVVGRRRLGKTTLLVHWAQLSGHPFIYWVGSHIPSETLLAQFSRQVWRHSGLPHLPSWVVCRPIWSNLAMSLAYCRTYDTICFANRAFSSPIQIICLANKCEI